MPNNITFDRVEIVTVIIKIYMSLFFSKVYMSLRYYSNTDFVFQTRYIIHFSYIFRCLNFKMISYNILVPATSISKTLIL
jgi:hypothetical protein